MPQTVATGQHARPAEREALALFIHTYRAQIKEAFRARFAAGGLGYYDSSDFFATVLRRADQLSAALGALASHDVRRMLREIVLEALSDCARSAVHERRLERDLRVPKRAWTERLTDAGPGTGAPQREDLDRLHLSRDEMDLARLRAGGMQHAKVALSLGVSPAAIRMRWVRLVDKARATWSERRD